MALVEHGCPSADCSGIAGSSTPGGRLGGSQAGDRAGSHTPAGGSFGRQRRDVSTLIPWRRALPKEALTCGMLPLAIVAGINRQAKKQVRQAVQQGS